MIMLSWGERSLRAWQAACSSLAAASAWLPAGAGDPEPVRTAMAELVDDLHEIDPTRAGRLQQSIGRCRDLMALWQLRVPLMQAIAAAQGEARARQRIAALDAQFLRVWPQAPVARRAALG